MQTKLLSEEIGILQADYKARTRPYLAVENIEINESTGSFIDILINVKNYGQSPATGVYLDQVVIGGADVKYDEETGRYTFTYTGSDTENPQERSTTDNDTDISVTPSGGYVTALIEKDYAPDLIFFPGREQVLPATVHKPTYQATVLETRVMHILIEYSWGSEQYYYVAKATLQDNVWKVIQDRGK